MYVSLEVIENAIRLKKHGNYLLNWLIKRIAALLHHTSTYKCITLARLSFRDPPQGPWSRWPASWDLPDLAPFIGAEGCREHQPFEPFSRIDFHLCLMVSRCVKIWSEYVGGSMVLSRPPMPLQSVSALFIQSLSVSLSFSLSVYIEIRRHT